jgi:hypothetical protein
MLAQSPTLPGFFPTTPRTNIATGLLIADVAVGLLNGVVGHFYANSLVESHSNPAEMLAGAGLIMLLSFVSLAVVVLNVTFFCMWLYRSFMNLYPLRSFARTSPGWAVGSFFIPFVNLVVPYLSMKELMIASSNPVDSRGMSNPYGESPNVGWWWTTYLGAGVVAMIGGVVGAFAQANHETRSIVPMLISQALRVVAAVLLIGIMRWVDARQLHRASLLTAAPPSDGPFRGPTY